MRRIWKDEGRPSTYPADLTIVLDDRGQHRLTQVDHAATEPRQPIAIAHAEGVAVAIAARDPGARLSIDVRVIADRSTGFEVAAFTQGERALLDRWPEPGRSEWIARFSCAGKPRSRRTARARATLPRERKSSMPTR